MTPKPLRQVQGYELDAIDARLVDVEAESTAATNMITAIRLQVERLDTTIRLWGKAILIGAPMLGAAGAWLVIRVAATPAPESAPRPAAHAAVVQASER